MKTGNLFNESKHEKIQKFSNSLSLVTYKKWQTSAHFKIMHLPICDLIDFASTTKETQVKKTKRQRNFVSFMVTQLKLQENKPMNLAIKILPWWCNCSRVNAPKAGDLSICRWIPPILFLCLKEENTILIKKSRELLPQIRYFL